MGLRRLTRGVTQTIFIVLVCFALPIAVIAAFSGFVH
jgi:hypothetical protein